MKKKEKKSVARRTLHYYWLAIKKYKWLALIGYGLTPVVILVRSILEPFILADMIEKVVNGGSDVIQLLVPEAIFLLVCYLVSNVVLEKLRLWAVWKMEVLAMYDMANMTFKVVNEQSMQFHSDRFSGSLVSQSNKFSGSFETFCDVLAWELLPLIVTAVSVVVVLAQRVPLFALGMLLFVVAYTMIAGLTSRKMGKLSEAEAAAATKTTGQLADAVTNIISVKSYAREKYEEKRYDDYQKKWSVAAFAFMHNNIKRDLMFSVTNVGLLAVILYFMINGQTMGIAVSTLVLIVNYSQEVLSVIWNVNGIFRHMIRAFGDAREMTEILDLVDDVVDADNAYELKVEKAGVEFSHIDFRHVGAHEDIFSDFSLIIKPGERVGLVGVSGSGKTTLTKLLLRFADVGQGEISIDGQDIKDVTQDSLRRAIAYVPQESSLFHRSIADNIAYAKPDAPREEIVRVAKLANADEFIWETPDGYETLVGERGVKLSGGQRQRISIARAMLKDAPILVLDEATSALDSESEAAIQEALGRLMQGRTSIVIAHRLSTVAALDRIIVLDHGKIVEQGRHDELLRAGGTYARLWARQSGAFFNKEQD